MKKLKIFLMLFFAIHFIVIIVVGFSRFSELTTLDNERVNSFGEIVIKKSKLVDNLNESTKDAVFFYSLFTGTNRGYAFFSPNVTSKKVELSFKCGDKVIELPFRSVESNTKFFGANLYFNSHLDRIKQRDSFLQSISTSFFNQDLTMKNLEVYLNLTMYSDINYTRENGLLINKKSMLGFKAKKN